MRWPESALRKLVKARGIPLQPAWKKPRRKGRAKEKGRIDLGQIDPYKIFELFLLQSDIIPPFVREYQFQPEKEWRNDFAWPDHHLAVEIEGGSWIYGRHNRAAGFQKDMDKYNTLAILGWHLLRFTPQDVETGKALDTIEEWFKVRK